MLEDFLSGEAEASATDGSETSKYTSNKEASDVDAAFNELLS